MSIYAKQPMRHGNRSAAASKPGGCIYVRQIHLEPVRWRIHRSIDVVHIDVFCKEASSCDFERSERAQELM
jgi:hypothetical protein